MFTNSITHKNRMHRFAEPIADVDLVMCMDAKLKITEQEKNTNCALCGSQMLAQSRLVCDWCILHDIQIGDDINNHYCNVCKLDDEEYEQMQREEDERIAYEQLRQSAYEYEMDTANHEYEMKNMNDEDEY